MSFDVARVRGLYPTLGASVAHLDGGYSALQPETVIRAIITTLRSSPAQPGSQSPRSQRSSTAVANARGAVGDLVGAGPQDVVLGGNVSTLLQRFADILSREWELGDEIVVSRLDHDANVRPWVTAARAIGVGVRWAEVDVETGELPEWQYEKLIGRATRLVTVPLANPATGVVPDVRRIAELAHRAGALVVADAGFAVAHLPLDLEALGADLLSVSMSTFGGPTVGALVARPGLLQEISDDSEETDPHRFEVGSLPIELIDGVTAAVDHLASLDEWASGTRRDRVITSIRAVGAQQSMLFEALEPRLRAIPGVTVLGGPVDELDEPALERVPVAAFTVAGMEPAKVGHFLQAHGVSVWTGPSGMSELMRVLGVDELGGAVHLGVMPHTTAGELDQLVRALRELVH
jgi:cysteine desulfurase family protein (TIGR01976 family)